MTFDKSIIISFCLLSGHSSRFDRLFVRWRSKIISIIRTTPPPTEPLGPSIRSIHLEYVPYNPECAPMGFAVFPRLKGGLRGKRFEDLDALQMEVRSTHAMYKWSWFADIFHKWVQSHRRCTEWGVLRENVTLTPYFCYADVVKAQHKCICWRVI